MPHPLSATIKSWLLPQTVFCTFPNGTSPEFPHCVTLAMNSLSTGRTLFSFLNHPFSVSDLTPPVSISCSLLTPGSSIVLGNHSAQLRYCASGCWDNCPDQTSAYRSRKIVACKSYNLLSIMAPSKLQVHFNRSLHSTSTYLSLLRPGMWHLNVKRLLR